MSTLQLAPTAGRETRSLSRIYWLETKFEFLKLLRLPAYSIPTLAFPVVFYVLFGLSMQFGPANFSMATYLLATYGCFGIIGAALFGFGVGVATERGQGWMLVKRASPMPLGAYFTAKIFMSMLFGTIIVALLCVLGWLFGDVSLSAGAWASLVAIQIAGALPFCAFGLLIGYVAGPNSAVGVVNLIYLPLAFASGLWIPIAALPDFFKKLAPALPPYHYSQLALKAVGADLGRPIWVHVTYLAVFTVVALGLAALAYRRDEGRTYG